MTTTTKYTLAKEVTMVWGQVNGIIDLSAAFMFGDGRYELAITLVIVGIVSSYLDNRVYFWVLERMAKDKVDFGRGTRL
jgi:hypothetical protein